VFYGLIFGNVVYRLFGELVQVVVDFRGIPTPTDSRIHAVSLSGKIFDIVSECKLIRFASNVDMFCLN